MTVEFEVEDHEAVRLLQDLLGWSLECLIEGHEDDVQVTNDLIKKLADQAGAQIGGAD